MMSAILLKYMVALTRLKMLLSGWFKAKKPPKKPYKFLSEKQLQ